jgi:hypothetical protein
MSSKKRHTYLVGGAVEAEEVHQAVVNARRQPEAGRKLVPPADQQGTLDFNTPKDDINLQAMVSQSAWLFPQRH